MENLTGVLEKTPFDLREIITLQSLREKSLPLNTKHNVPLDKINGSNMSNSTCGHFKSNLVSSMASMNLRPTKATNLALDIEPALLQPNTFPSKSNEQITDDLLSNDNDRDDIASGSILLPSVNDSTKLNSNSMDFLSVSPSFGPCSLSFDNQSFDETTPEEFAPINYLRGISNINYEFTFSDNSAENSISEDVGDASSICHGDDNISMQSKPLDTISTFSIDEFDPLRSTQRSVEPLEKPQNLFATDLCTDDQQPITLIDSVNSPNQGQLPSPLKPVATSYKGFSNSNIPSISCNTGDLSLPHGSKLDEQ